MKKDIYKKKILELINNKELTPKTGAALLQTYQEIKDERIAVIGIAGVFPDANDINEFWGNLKSGKDSVTEIPETRWALDRFYNPDTKSQNTSYSKWGAFIKNVDCFDPLFFNISPREAIFMEPPQRLFLMEAWKALEDAGYPAHKADGAKCGVFVGYGGGDYIGHIKESQHNADAFSFMGNSGAILASRIAYFLNLKGPAISFDTACSSSLVAIHLACENIRNQTCEIAIAGGVMCITSKEYYILSSKTGMLSPTGKCNTFDNDANGFVPGEAVGAVVLKPLNNAIKDGDHIYGVIVNSDINQDGKTNGITAPNGSSQSELIERLYKNGVNPETIGYIEAHGTGTPLGDPIEIFALSDVFQKFTSKKNYCAIGSIKTNIGHTLVAAGISGFIKTILCLKNKLLVPSINFNTPNKHIDFENSPFYVNTECKPWKKTDDSPLRAAISAFGFSGTNCHMILEEAPETSLKIPAILPSSFIITCSAHTQELLDKYLRELLKYLSNSCNNTDIANLSYTLVTSKTHHNIRNAFIVSSLDELKSGIAKVLEGDRSVCFYSENSNQVDDLKHVDNLEGIMKAIRNQEQNYKDALEKFAILYVSGIKTNWELLFKPEHYLKVILPYYKFNLERYWIEKKNSVDKQSTSSKIHPMVSKNISTLKEQAYEIAINDNEFFVTDHLVHGKKILPGVALLEAVTFCGTNANTQRVTELKNVVWLNTIEVTSSVERFNLSFKPETTDLSFVFWKSDASDKIIKIAQGNVLYSPLSSDKNNVVNIDELKSSATDKYEGHSCYEAFKSVGFEYGYSFRVIDKIYFGSDYAVSEIRLPEKVQSTIDCFVLHPALMDGTLQTVIAFMGQLIKDYTASYVPFSVKSIKIFDKTKIFNHVYVTMNTYDSAESTMVFDIRLLDDKGNLLVEMNSFIARPLMKDQGTALYFKPQFVETKLNIEVKDASNLLFVIHNSEDYELPKPFIHEENINIVSVRPGTEFRKLNERAYQVSMESPDDIAVLFKQFELKQNLQILFIDHKKNVNACQSIVNDNSFQQIFSLIHYLCKNGETEFPHKFIYLYEGENLPVCEAFEGFFMALGQESSQVKFKVINNKDQSVNSIETGVHEFADDFNDFKFVAFSQKLRYLREWTEQTKEMSQTPALPIKKNGVYIVTGGLGGVGTVFTKYIVSLGGNVCILGRSEMSDKMKDSLQQLKKGDGSIEYYAGDVAEIDFLSMVITEIRTQYGQINGIIHAAGIKSDQFFNKKSIDDFKKVLRPKVDGVRYLDELTQKDHLDFFVLVSALAGTIGNAGQTDYCYANSFLDSFSNYRETLRRNGLRFGKSVSIAWPLWKNGGFKINAQQKEFFKQVLGLYELDNAAAIKIFEEVMSSHEGRIAVTYGNITKNRSLLVQKSNKKTLEKDFNAGYKDELEEVLKNSISNVLSIDKKLLGVQKDFGIFGFDSITFTELANILNNQYHLDLTPAVFFEYSNLNELSNYLIRNYNEILQKAFSTSSLPEIKEKIKVPQDGFSRFKPQETIANNISNAIEISSNKVPVAIVGMSGIMPQSQNLDEFWNHLENERDLITEIPKSRWNWEEYMGDPQKEDNKTNCKWGAFVNNVDHFDAEFFSISPKEASSMDPQQRMFLQIVYNTVEDAGFKPSDLWDKKVALYVGVSTSDYTEILREENVKVESYSALGLTHSVLANRISFYMNWHGPSEPIDTACSSSLVAIDRAVRILQEGECELAVAGGINCILSPSIYITFSKAGMLNPEGRCKTFDKDANGYVRGEGGAAVLLKLLPNAIKDHDNIYGIIKGTSVNHGGKTNSITSPNPNAQAAVIMEAIKKANIDISTISYIETHGTGTGIGDPIEINGLKKAFRESTNNELVASPCGIGSIKTNVGHLESAAGIVGLVKVLMSFKNKKIPASLHFKELNPYINLRDTSFYIVDKTIHWNHLHDKQGNIIPHRAGLSSFGFGGVNAHIVLEEFISATTNYLENNSNHLIILSARNEDRLKVYVNNLYDFLVQNRDNYNLRDIAYTLQVGRDDMSVRFAFITSGMEQLISTLKSYIENINDTSLFFYNTQKTNDSYLNDLFIDSYGIEFIEELFKAGAQEKIAKLWVSGVKIPWRKMYTGMEPFRVHLPTYPFAPTSHWVKKSNKTDADKKLQPPGSELIINKIQLLPNDWFFKEHILDTEKLMPAVVYIDQIMEVLKKIGKAYSNLQEIVWTNPLFIYDEPIELFLEVNEKNKAFIAKSVIDGTPKIHFQGKFYDYQEDFIENYLPLEQIQNECREYIDGELHYQWADSMGIHFYNSMRSIKNIYHNMDNALVYFRTGINNLNHQKHIIPIPYLDGAMQGISSFYHHKKNLNPILPYYVESVVFAREKEDIAFVYLKKKKENVFDIYLLNSKNQICIKLTNLNVREININKSSSHESQVKFNENTTANNHQYAENITTNVTESAEFVREAVVKSIKDALEIHIDENLYDQNFNDIGIDSVTGVQVISNINKYLYIDLKAIVLFDSPTINALANFIMEHFPNAGTNIENTNQIEDDELKLLLKGLSEGNFEIRDLEAKLSQFTQ